MAPKKKAASRKATKAKAEKTVDTKKVTVAKAKPIADRMKRIGTATAASPKEKIGTQEVSAGARERKAAPSSNSRAMTSAMLGSKSNRTGQRAFAPKARSIADSTYEKHALAKQPAAEKESDVLPIISSKGQELGKGKGYPIGRVGKRQMYAVELETGHRQHAFKVNGRFILVGRS